MDMPARVRSIPARRVGGLGLMLSMLLMLAGALRVDAQAEPGRWKLEGWQSTDFSRSSIAWDEIRSGGPPKDGIPSIDMPVFGPAPSEEGVIDIEPVIGLEIAGDARAYPLRILIWHEIVNDVVGGVPVAITYCPLCNSAVVFDRRVAGRTLAFGTTGKLRHSDLVMYDRQTESWWQQFLGEAIVGELLGRTLEITPARLESFADFKARFPDGQVLQPGDGRLRPYGRNPYVGYDTSQRPFIYDGAMPEGVEPLARVVVVRPQSGEVVAVALAALRKKGAMTVGGVALSWRAGQASALDSSEIAKGRDVGSVVATVEGRDVAYDVTFAFAVKAFHPGLAIITD